MTGVWVNDDRFYFISFFFFSFLIFHSHSCTRFFSVCDLYSPAAKEQQSHDLRSISPYFLCISLGVVRRGWSCFDCYVAPGSPAANGEIQLESEVNNPVWEKTREFQRENERGKPIWALHGERMGKRTVKESEIGGDLPTDPVLKCTMANKSIDKNLFEWRRYVGKLISLHYIDSIMKLGRES